MALLLVLCVIRGILYMHLVVRTYWKWLNMVSWRIHNQNRDHLQCYQSQWYQSQIASFGVNLIPYNGTWNQIGRRHHCDSGLQSKFSFNEWQIDLAQFSTACKLFATSLGRLLGLFFLLLFSILCKKLQVPTITDTYFSKQWAAVRTHWGSIRVPPQKCRP